MKLRPLEPVSTFVTEEMPGLLEREDPRWFRQRVYHVACQAEGAPAEAARDGEHRRVALLDLLMLQAAMRQKGQTCPRELCGLVKLMLKPGEAPIITYEGLVLDNPEFDMRAFTRGPVGTTEKAFYNAHRAIEHALTPIIESVDALMLCLEGRESGPVMAPSDLASILKRICVSFGTPALRNMPGGNTDTGHFARFRPYFKSIDLPNGKVRGPSGAFSGQMPLLEVIFRGDSPAKNTQSYFNFCSDYFSVREKDRLREAITAARSGRTLAELAKGSDDPVAKEYVGMLEWYFYDFRVRHLQAVYAQIKQQVRDKEEGTGGIEDIETFLRDRRGPIPQKRYW